MMINTQRGPRINTDNIDEFHIEEFKDRTVVLRAYRHANHERKIGYSDRPITPRISRDAALAEAARIKPGAPVMELKPSNNYGGWDWRPIA
jgi:hypothetical protein